MSLICIRRDSDKVVVAADGRITTSGGDICAENAVKIMEFSNGGRPMVVGSVGESDISDEFFEFVRYSLSESTLKVEPTPLIKYVRMFKAKIEAEGYDLGDDSQGFVFVDAEHTVGIAMTSYQVHTFDFEGANNAYGNCREYAMALLDAGIGMEDIFKMASKRFNTINSNITVIEIRR